MAKIMLAEDDATMVNLLTTLLLMDGFDVVAVQPEEDVPEAVGRVHPDLLVLDVHFSQQNGLDVLDALRAGDREHALRVIMISGLNVEEVCKQRGADDFLLKPFMPDDLIRILRKNVKAS